MGLKRIIYILGFPSRCCACLFYPSSIESRILQICLLPCNYSNNYKVIITKHNVATSGDLDSFRLPTCRARSWPAVEEQEADRGESEPQLAVGAFWRPSLSSLLRRGQASASITSTLGSTASQSTSATTTGWSGPLPKASLTPGTSWTCLQQFCTVGIKGASLWILFRSTSEDEVCGEFYDDYPEDCCPPGEEKNLYLHNFSFLAHLVYCLMPHRSDESIVWPLHSFPWCLLPPSKQVTLLSKPETGKSPGFLPLAHF